jgi:hypothetical protein
VPTRVVDGTVREFFCFMVQPAHKRRMVEDESSPELEDLEKLEIAKAANISGPDKDLDIALNESHEELATSKQAENAATFSLDTNEKDNPPDNSVKSPPPTFEDFAAETPSTPKHQVPVNQTTSTPRSVNVQRTMNEMSVRMESQKSPSPEEEIKPRMVMTRMVLHNFKSYAGRQDIGPFHKVGDVFSCVIQLFITLT